MPRNYQITIFSTTIRLHWIESCSIPQSRTHWNARINSLQFRFPSCLGCFFSTIQECKYHGEVPTIQQGSKKTVLTDTKGKEGSKAGQKACRRCHPSDYQEFLSLRYYRPLTEYTISTASRGSDDTLFSLTRSSRMWVARRPTACCFNIRI